MKQVRQGMNDFYRGQLENPYKEGTAKYLNWELGFNRAYFENLEKVKQREKNGRREIVQGS